MNNKPFFSIVLPTLNRADYLGYAIQTALNQTYRNFELIVSDNSSTDATEHVVKSFADERIKYYKTEKVLPMYDSWEFALERAEGEYITFLGDDDGHSVIYLESLKKVIDANDTVRIVSCRMADYHYRPAGSDRPEYLTTPAFTNELLAYDTRQLIKNIYIENRLCKGKPHGTALIPQLINTVYHNSVLSAVKKAVGRVLPKILASDYYLAAIALSFTEKYYYLDAPLSFHGISPHSTTSSITIEPKGAALKRSQPELAVFKAVPIKDIYVPYNFVADALLLAKTDLHNRLDHFEIDLAGYYVNIFYNFYFLELAGHDTSQEKKDFFAALDKFEPNLKGNVILAISNKKERLKSKLQINPRTTHIYRLIRNLRRRKLLRKITFSKGFNTIVECARCVEHQFIENYRSQV